MDMSSGFVAIIVVIIIVGVAIVFTTLKIHL